MCHKLQRNNKKCQTNANMCQKMKKKCKKTKESKKKFKLNAKKNAKKVPKRGGFHCIGANIRTCQKIQCLPYKGFLRICKNNSKNRTAQENQHLECLRYLARNGLQSSVPCPVFPPWPRAMRLIGGVPAARLVATD